MHGHKRSDYKASQRNPNVAASLALKAEQWHALSQDLAQRRLRNDTSDITLALLEKLLLVNPDPLYLWNHRRELLVTVESNFCLETELRLTQAALANNPKAYGAWFHRKWCLVQTHHNNKLSDIKELLTSELQLTALVLQRDERNFHCWNYRTFIVSCQLALVTPQTTCPDGSWNIVQGSDDDSSEHYKHRHQHNSLIVGAQIAMRNDVASSEPEQLPLPIQASAAVAILQQEYDFSRQKIRDNFSNFSAFHYRSKLLPLLIAADERELKQIILAELELVESAVFTEPDDQTAWWYQRFLLDLMSASNNQQQQQQQPAWYKERLQSHIDNLRELAQEVTESKWALLGLLQVLERLEIATGNEQERREILMKLIDLDADRSERYKYMLSKIN